MKGVNRRPNLSIVHTVMVSEEAWLGGGGLRAIRWSLYRTCVERDGKLEKAHLMRLSAVAIIVFEVDAEVYLRG